MKNGDAINSPFRYAGGKFYARHLILEHIIRHTNYIEPFCGGASIFFAKPKVQYNQLNDIDNELINTMLIIRDKPDELIETLKIGSLNIPSNLIEDVPVGEPIPARKELHGFFKNTYKPTTNLERAARWFYLNRTSYSGIMNFQNMYWGYGDKYSMQPKFWARNILRTSAKLQNVQLTNLDFEEVIDNAPNDSLLFVDPPYYNAAQDKFYQHFFSNNDHHRLVECVRRNRNRLHFFITYDNVENVRDLYSFADTIYDKEWNYCLQRTDDQKEKTQRKGKRYKGKELFIMINMREPLLSPLPFLAFDNPQ